MINFIKDYMEWILVLSISIFGIWYFIKVSDSNKFRYVIPVIVSMFLILFIVLTPPQFWQPMYPVVIAEYDVVTPSNMSVQDALISNTDLGLYNIKDEKVLKNLQHLSPDRINEVYLNADKTKLVKVRYYSDDRTLHGMVTSEYVIIKYWLYIKN